MSLHLQEAERQRRRALASFLSLHAVDLLLWLPGSTKSEHNETRCLRVSHTGLCAPGLGFQAQKEGREGTTRSLEAGLSWEFETGP